MKNVYSISIFILISGIFLISCESENNTTPNDPEFSIEFSDGTIIGENDLLFYDSSTHMLFLKEALILDYEEIKEHNFLFSTFAVLVGKDTIYKGILYPSVFSAMPPVPIYIFRDFDYYYGNNIVQIQCYIDSLDFRNDLRIIHALENNGLLHHGLSCTIDSVRVTSCQDHSDVVCTFTIKNHDRINYYIPDPEKMGQLDFNYYTGGLNFNSQEGYDMYFLRWSVPGSDWDNLTMDDLSLLRSENEVTYTFTSSDYDAMEMGLYTGYLRFWGTKDNTPEFTLEQPDGRIWVGGVYSGIDSVMVE